MTRTTRQHYSAPAMDVIDIRVESRILTGSDDDWGGTNEDIGGIDLSAPMAAFEIPMF